jgi:photosystem II oxygen-evolving enhancer protein 2
MLKSLLASLLIILSITLSSCSAGVSGLQSYVNPTKGYEFLYPNGWIPVDLKSSASGVEVVFRDLIERSENLSVIVSDIPANKSLEDLGTPSEVGYRFLQLVNNNPNLDRQAEFITAESNTRDGQTYYHLEYEVELSDRRPRHNVATVAVSRGKLFTFNLSTTTDRWSKVKDTFEVAARSFTVR